MNNRWLVTLLLAYCSTLTAAALRQPADADCRTLISTSPNGAVLFTCPIVTCDDSLPCTRDNTVVVDHPDIGKSIQYYCRCSTYSPRLGCLGFGYINPTNTVWTYAYMRNDCANPCTDFAWPPVIAPKTLCKC